MKRYIEQNMVSAAKWVVAIALLVYSLWKIAGLYRDLALVY